jgi:tetratricopeptide (TPR) repeat protein
MIESLEAVHITSSFALSAIVASSLFAAPPPSKAIAALMQEADEAFELGKFGEAVSKYEQAEKLDPAFDDADRLERFSGFNAEVAAPEAGLRGNDEASAALERRIGLALGRAWRHHPERNDLLYDASHTLADHGATDAALALTAEALQQNPGNMAALRVNLMVAEADALKNPSRAAADVEHFRAIFHRLLATKGDAEDFYVGGVSVYMFVTKVNLEPSVKLTLILQGKSALEKAKSSKPDYFEAMTYHSLLLREEAKLAADPEKRESLTAQADKERADVVEIVRKRKSAAESKPDGKQ